MATNSSVQTISVYVSDDFPVSEGVAQSEGMSFADDLVLDDIYRLWNRRERRALSLWVDDTGSFRVAGDSPTGRAGNQVVLDSCVTVMGTDSSTQEILLLVELEDGCVEEVYLLPLAHLIPQADYRLVRVDRHAATQRFAEVACVSFSKGTHITMGNGAQVPIEDLKVGDRVLTRDEGPQPIRWIGQTTIRATGDFAPILITKGALHNANDLLVSPDHRLFVYQRQDKLGTGRSDVLVKVGNLVDGERVIQQPGGYVDYFQLLFDSHQIIYAEGIAAESLLIDARNRAAVPDSFSGNEPQPTKDHLRYEVSASLLPSTDAVRLLRKAASS
ncbi:Hint domain-containing protein [Cognatiyoonia sediminum]|uniref:Hint domain-containing protein n=1 Tax=Cognatiyoonia sediminum TaxID=1508389 RepID=A0A1M5MSS5_9RHOB|nr:Hint domain-containing protein [Cognatiyoonia sediminum]SHG79969.1 Hint domain-containing protein [Cognatiyoonia sediminum]